MDKPTGDSERLLRLLSQQADGLLNDEQREELLAIVSNSKEARKSYIEHMFLHSLMHRAGRLTNLGPQLPEELKGSAGTLCDDPNQLDRPTNTLPLGFLGNLFRSGTGFLFRPLVSTLLLAVGLPGLLFIILVLGLMRQPAPLRPVATVTRMHECVWSEGAAVPSGGTRLYAGEQLRLTEGLLEIAFDQGAKVLLEGPAIFNVTNGGKGFLHNGNLVAKLRKGDSGFTIQTPSVTIVDLGTEFGVCVDEERGIAEVEVFQGSVELQTMAESKPTKTPCLHLVSGQAVRIELANRPGSPLVVRKIKPNADSFVRHMPSEPAKLSGPDDSQAIVANFTNGEGNTQVDQFPGIAGSGWATGWGVGKANQLKCITSVEQSNPLLGGGEYLSVLVEREPGGSDALDWRAVDREFALKDRVDLTKPYVVSFNLRIDALDRFGEASDRLSICSRNVPQANFSRDLTASSGWHICMVGKGNEFAKSGTWAFLQRTGEGKFSAVDSGIVPREGEVYSFRILVDPRARQWTPSIAINGGQWTTYKQLAMRSPGTAKENKYWPFLHFQCFMEGGNEGEESEKIGFSIDSVRVTAQGVP